MADFNAHVVELHGSSDDPVAHVAAYHWQDRELPAAVEAAAEILKREWHRVRWLGAQLIEAEDGVVSLPAPHIGMGARTRSSLEERVNAALACGSCARHVSEMRGTCEMCGRDSDGIRRDVERRVEPLLRLRAGLRASTHIYASYELSLVEQELRGFGVDLDDHSLLPQTPVRGRRGVDSAAVGDSAVSSTALFLGELERLPPTPGGVPRTNRNRDPAAVAISPPFSSGDL
jgi:hypothetical protein